MEISPATRKRLNDAIRRLSELTDGEDEWKLKVVSSLISIQTILNQIIQDSEQSPSSTSTETLDKKEVS